jgi:hypothetical protein
MAYDLLKDVSILIVWKKCQSSGARQVEDQVGGFPVEYHR